MDAVQKAISEAGEAAKALGDAVLPTKNDVAMKAAIRCMKATLALNEALLASGKFTTRRPWWARLRQWVSERNREVPG